MVNVWDLTNITTVAQFFPFRSISTDKFLESLRGLKKKDFTIEKGSKTVVNLAKIPHRAPYILKYIMRTIFQKKSFYCILICFQFKLFNFPRQNHFDLKSKE